jgi:hypothetical protein
MKIFVNPGAGPVKGATVENANINIQKFIEDCGLPGLRVNDQAVIDKGDGRFIYKLVRDGYAKSIEVQMPGLPLDQVRFMDYKGQNAWYFPRLYVDGSSWFWLFALIDESYFKEDEE